MACIESIDAVARVHGPVCVWTWDSYGTPLGASAAGTSPRRWRGLDGMGADAWPGPGDMRCVGVVLLLLSRGAHGRGFRSPPPPARLPAAGHRVPSAIVCPVHRRTGSQERVLPRPRCPGDGADMLMLMRCTNATMHHCTSTYILNPEVQTYSILRYDQRYR